jgi:Ni2+-binding GTPase involved in maturation of urease and hydrogenase
MKATYVTIGGFLGAGKTTAMLRLAELLAARGQQVGLITNDQSRGLVDTGTVAAGGFAVREITDGCFCCRFPSLIEAAQSLARDVRPDVFLAEPVGSCTDLRATVQLPLARLYGDAYRVAPLSVMVDPLRAARAFGVDPGASFSPRVQYIYAKQLEEAELLVLNKIDIVSAELRERLESTLARRFPRAEMHRVSARTGLGIAAWLDRLLETAPIGERPTMDVDYDLYADGEALLGWVNATARLAGERAVDGNLLLRRLAESVRERLTAAAVEVAHLKVALIAGGGAPHGRAERATIHLLRTDGPVEMPRELSGSIHAGELVVNLRAEDDPARLHALLLEAIAAAGRHFGTAITVQDEAHFRPGRPVPTHRVAVE